MSARKQIHVFPKMSNTSFEICECLWGRLWVTRRTELGPCRLDDSQWIAMIPLNGLPAIHLPPLLFFQCGIWQQRGWGFSAFVREKRAEWKGAVDSHFFAPIRGPGTADTSTTATWNHWERCVGLWEGDLLFFCSPLWSAGESCELRCWAHGFVTLSLLTAGARLLQVTAKWGVCARCRENVLYYACICLLSTDALQKCILGSMLNSFSLARRTAVLNLVVMCMWGETYRDILASSS